MRWNLDSFLCSIMPNERNYISRLSQQGLLESGSHWIVVAEVTDYPGEPRKITYAVESAAVEVQGEGELERLCRTAVGQFIDSSVVIGCLPMVLPLQLARLPWTGEVMPFKLTIPLEQGVHDG
jgi:hypothetical protein